VYTDNNPVYYIDPYGVIGYNPVNYLRIFAELLLLPLNAAQQKIDEYTRIIKLEHNVFKKSMAFNFELQELELAYGPEFVTFVLDTIDRSDVTEALPPTGLGDLIVYLALLANDKLYYSNIDLTEDQKIAMEDLKTSYYELREAEDELEMAKKE